MAKPVAVPLIKVSVGNKLSTQEVPTKPAQLQLANANSHLTTLPTPSSPRWVTLTDQGEGIFALSILAEQQSNQLNVELIIEINAALAAAARQPSLKTLLLYGSEQNFAHGGRDACQQALQSGLLQTLLDFPCPVIAVVTGNATGCGFLLASLCDFMLLNQDSHYGYAHPQQNLLPSAVEYQLFAMRRYIVHD